MKSLRVSHPGYYGGLSGLGLSYLLANKKFLVQIKISDCDGISSRGFHCLSTLTNLTNLACFRGELDDIGLNKICSSCLLIEYLNVRRNDHITKEGLNNLHHLTHLKTLILSRAYNSWSAISDEGLSNICASLVNLTSVEVNERDWPIKRL
jgi:hypothetical protein